MKAISGESQFFLSFFSVCLFVIWLLLYVVHFNQRLGAVHPKHWLKSTFFHFLKIFAVKNIKNVYFDLCLGCASLKPWSKYTTTVYYLALFVHIHDYVCFCFFLKLSIVWFVKNVLVFLSFDRFVLVFSITLKRYVYYSLLSCYVC